MNSDITGWFTTEDGVHVPIHGTQSKMQAMNQFAEQSENKPKISRSKSDFIDEIRHQTNVNLGDVLEKKNLNKRDYIGVHLENLDKNSENNVRTYLAKRGFNIEDNGGYGQVIYHKRG